MSSYIIRYKIAPDDTSLRENRGAFFIAALRSIMEICRPAQAARQLIRGWPMLFYRFGDPGAPAVVLLHGGGLAAWSWQNIVPALQEQYQVITPVIAGHGAAAGETFISIESSAQDLLAYLDAHCNGRVLALAGLSLGAQIIVEALSVRPDIARYAIIESALACPLRGTKLTARAARLSFGLSKQRWFAKLQAAQLGIPREMFADYFRDSAQISRQSLVNMLLSNGTYALKPGIDEAQARTLIIAGGRELAAIRRSARQLGQRLPNSELLILPGLKHGQLSLSQPQKYLRLLRQFLAP